ncbi:hypothetical protein FRACYDRAFT_236592 [Fragilariopsis cylindrus CCMP1102]|uniref:Uncharacterized protein n=1 Tax=Fragilariopsis cylindrus CCMP1102 TaxID=635003 RepID=A0A1E7FJV7_9STRA|nr:hypothetical protein FRACYDRAFT_236592 [Fragilariopsis cylindrus CCMP1102]|eukprot:OEU18315.1 hypothetical protein FRACYDRAFT_236592 [Fragilariopsis cylindrus CCMP1102]
MGTDKPSSNYMNNNNQKIRAASLTGRAPTITTPGIIANTGANPIVVPKTAVRIGSTVNESANTITSSANNRPIGELQQRVVCNLSASTLSDKSNSNSKSASTSSERSTSNLATHKITVVQKISPPPPPPPPISTKKSKGSRTQELIEGDKVELCQWIKSSNSGDHKDFKVGKDRRFALHRLCRTLIDVNPDLLLTHNSYGDSHTTSWANTIINADPNFGVLRSRSTNKTIGTIHGRNVLFTRYPLKNFVTNLRSLKNAIDTEFINVDFDQEAYDKEIIKYPMQRMLKVGYPRWNHPDNHAKKLLEEDTKKGGLYEKENLKPKDLKVTRPEYREFPDDVFRSRVYKALSGHREKPYWQNERNKSMRKKKVTEENLQQTEWT